MKKLLIALFVFGLILSVSGLAMASNIATQTVTYEVQAINEISVSGNPGALVISTATAGSAPNDATNSATTYAITTNQTNRKITGKIDTAMSSGVTLKINLVAPAGGSSAGDVSLTTSDHDLVTGISTLNESGNTITYTLSATSAAGVVASASKTVTLTLTAGA